MGSKHQTMVKGCKELPRKPTWVEKRIQELSLGVAAEFKLWSEKEDLGGGISDVQRMIRL